MQYRYMPSGDRITDATPAAYKPSDSIGFHIMAAGSRWLEIDGQRTILEAGTSPPFHSERRTGSAAAPRTD